MARQSPFLQRRGDAFGFRIAIPADLQPQIGRREFTLALGTSDKCHAVPAVLLLAARAKRLFSDLRDAMSKSDEERIRELLKLAREKALLRERIEELEDKRESDRQRHKVELERATLIARAEALELALKKGAAHITPGSASRVASDVPMLRKVIDAFLAGYLADKKSAMFSKHKTVLPLLLEVVGDRPVSEIRQAHLNDFFAVIQRLPSRWKDEVRRRGITVAELADEGHALTMAPKTFEDTYKACVRAFLIAAKRDWADHGFPAGLTTEGITYAGDREEGERRQRAFTRGELKQLFEGAAMRALSESPDDAHKFWLPHIGLFTGARVNEICQVNPQTDISDEGGIWHFRFTGDTEAAPGIKKRVKNSTSRRRVPIHSALVELGFLDYCKAAKAAGAKHLFPAWSPRNGKASPNAEKWFKRFLDENELRDESKGARLSGMHAFRHTFLNRALNLKIVGAEHITGHAGAKDKVVRDYEGELDLQGKQDIIEKVTFDLELFRPVSPKIKLAPARRAPRKPV